MSTAPEAPDPTQVTPADEKTESRTLRVVTWFSMGIAVAAVGIFVGRELRSRYKFKRRTPYDFYSSAGEYQAGDFGVGI
jgi:hypothetical protein